MVYMGRHNNHMEQLLHIINRECRWSYDHGHGQIVIAFRLLSSFIMKQQHDISEDPGIYIPEYN
jgi:hypothetical protein